MIQTEGERSRRSRSDLAARAGWLYYIAGRTQDDIARLLNVSRQTAQRLIARAVAEKLVKFRFDHPLESCFRLAERLAGRFRLAYAEVVPSDEGEESVIAGLAVAGARYVETWLAQRPPLVIGFSTGRTLRAVAAEVSPLAAPQHKLYSLCGTLAADGRLVALDPAQRIAETTGAQYYPMTLPLFARSAEEHALAIRQHPYHILKELNRSARLVLAGIAPVAWQAPLHRDGFLSDAELARLMEAGAAGEIAGCVFDGHGARVETGIAAHVNALWIGEAAGAVRVVIGGGAAKAAPIRIALESGIAGGVITDEQTASLVLGD
jgi:DNA-binding transcriptional regulator LsrR (DeoR family)